MFVLLACQGQRPVVDVPAEQTDSTGTPATPAFVVADVDAAATPMISFADGSEVSWVRFGELTGDGVVDAVVEAYVPDPDIGSQRRTYLVAGPLVDRVVPRDGVVLPHGTWVTFIGEMTGSPPDDLLLSYDISGTLGLAAVAAGPWDGVTVPSPTGSEADPPVALLDVDRDGVLDRLTAWESSSTELAITWGPADRWSGPADVHIGLCRDGGVPDDEQLAAEMLASVGDLDGDGRAELTVGAFAWFYDGVDCGGFTVSVPTSGAVDPFAAGAAGVWDRLVLYAEPVGDWDGDGASDLLDASPDRDPIFNGWSPTGEVWLAPRLDGDGLQVGEVATVGAGIYPVGSLPFDLDGDGGAEVLAQVEDPEPGPQRLWWLVVTSGAALSGGPPLGTAAYDADVYSGFLDNGRATLVVFDGVDLRRLDLGPASAVVP